jgi:hypothetical protein
LHAPLGAGLRGEGPVELGRPVSIGGHGAIMTQGYIVYPR